MFTAAYNMIFSWQGISLILRVYLYSLSFLLIFNAHSSKKSNYLDQYRISYGKRKGYILYSLESRVLPYALIYLLVILFGLSSFHGSQNKMISILLNFLEGKYTNLMMYCLFLSLILRFQKNFISSIIFFLTALFLFYWLDYWFQRNIDINIHYSIYKNIKLVLFFFFVLWDETEIIRLKTLKNIFVSILLSASVFLMSFFSIYTIFSTAGKNYGIKNESGIILARMGYSEPLYYIARRALSENNAYKLHEIERYFDSYKIKYPISPGEWKKLVFSGSIRNAEISAHFLLKFNIDPGLENLVDFAYKMSSSPESDSLHSIPNYTLLTSKLLNGKDKYLINRISSSGKNFTAWGIQVLGLGKSKESILFLVTYLTNIDRNISNLAYYALRNITGKDPAREANISTNTSDVIKYFKDIYLYRGIEGE